MSRHKYVPHCEWFELKLGMCGEEGLLTNFPKFHGDCATSTMFCSVVAKFIGQTWYFPKCLEGITGNFPKTTHKCRKYLSNSNEIF